MSFHDAYQSPVCSTQNVGLLKTNNFVDDDREDEQFCLPLLCSNELKEMLSRIPLEMRHRFDILFRKAIYSICPQSSQPLQIAPTTSVEEAVIFSLKNQAATSIHGAEESGSRSLELRFSNNIVSPLLTGNHIKAIGGVPLEVTLVDSRTNEVVKSGPEASGRVEILVLEAQVDDVTGEDVKSEKKLVWKMEGSRKSSRVKNLSLHLMQGTASLPMVSFENHDPWTKISKLKLGAKFVDNFNGIRVKEAKTESFLLKDCRNKAREKHRIPSLHDKVWRLYRVAKNKCLSKNLTQAEIITVEDFLVHLFRQPQRLKEIFDRSNHAKSWKVTVKHARECPAELKYSFDPKTKVVFNVSGEVLGLVLDDHFLSSDTLTRTQKEFAKNLVFSAFENWGDVNVIPVHEDQVVAKTEPVTFGKNVVLDALDLDIDETCLFGNMVSDGKPPNPEALPKALRRKYDEIYHGFESVCISNQLELEAPQRNKLCYRWKILFCVVTFKIRSLPENGLAGIRAHKKPRF